MVSAFRLAGRRARLALLVEYSDDFGVTWNQWEEKYNGPAPINQNNFVIPPGESQLIYTFEDRTSYLHRTRWYRMWEVPQLSMWTTGRHLKTAALGSAAVLFLLFFPVHLPPGGHVWQAAGGSVHVFLFAGLAWMWGRAISPPFRGWVLWGSLAVVSACVEGLQSHMGRSAEWMDWLYGAGGAACICGTWRWHGRFPFRWIGLVVLSMFPLAWEVGMVRMETRAFPVVADPEAVWSLRGWELNGVQLSAVSGEGFRIDKGADSGTSAQASNPGVFRTPAVADWSRMASLKVDIYWPAPAPAIMAIRVDDRRGNPLYAERFQREFPVTRGWNAVHIPVAELERTFGGRPMQLEAIRQWGVFLVSDIPFDYFLFGEVRLDLHQEVP